MKVTTVTREDIDDVLTAAKALSDKDKNWLILAFSLVITGINRESIKEVMTQEEMESVQSAITELEKFKDATSHNKGSGKEG